MNHTVLARKWRPKKFADLVGQQNTVTVLQNIISSGRLHHAYLLTGTRGVGKTTIARIIAKALNCLNPQNSEPCGSCENCQQIDRGRYVDVIEIDAASNTGVDNIREVLENAQYAPTSGKYKIYIIDEVHMLSKSAFNAMLKTLEEPPAHVVFILATTDVQKVPITILSRCLQLKLRNLSAVEIEDHLRYVLEQEQVGAEGSALDLLAQAANGSMRDALSLTDQAIAFSNANITETITRQMLGISDNSSIIEILTAIQQADSVSLINICQRLNSEGASLENILEQINYSLFNIGLAQLSPQPQLSNELKNLAKLISLQDCQLYFEISNLGLEQIRKVQNQYPIFVMNLLRMIAFTIGSHQDKQLIIQAANCTTELVPTTVTTTTAIQQFKEEKLANTPKPTVAAELTENIQITQALTPQEIANEQQNDLKTKELAPWEESITTEEIPLAAEPVNSEQLIAALPEETESRQEVTETSKIEGPLDQFSNWLEFVKAIDLTQIDKTIAVVLSNCSQTNSNNPDELTLVINDSYRQLVTTACVDQIEQMLFSKYQRHFDLSFNFVAEIQDGTLKSHNQAEANALQQSAEEAIQSDLVIQDLITNFAAKIVPNSIKPL
ncbi:MAG TPA: DNA polymerase III subunit gamma/tau [Burkholderiales bacterium]|nr:DNA polymerase III subunit gamma/tau [Burkholderiales bacterium]